MVSRWITIFLVALALSARAWAGGEVVSELVVDGVTYHDVRWGPVNQGKVVIFHNHGSSIVPVEKLPEEYARRFGYRPPVAMDNSASVPSPTGGAEPPKIQGPWYRPGPVVPTDRVPPQERVAFEAARTAKMVLNGALVDKSGLTMLTGFIRAKAKATGEEHASEGLMLELANRKHTDRPVPENMEMRPGLWEGTGEEVFLRDYSPNIEQGTLLRVYAQEGDSIKGYRTYFVAQELTYEQWKKLR